MKVIKEFYVHNVNIIMDKLINFNVVLVINHIIIYNWLCHLFL
jgi:hypothetical protein